MKTAFTVMEANQVFSTSIDDEVKLGNYSSVIYHCFNI